MINTYKQKYLKYKVKYNKLKFQIGGNKNRIEADNIYDTEPCRAFQLYKMAIKEGDIESYYKLAKMYKNGYVVSKDDIEAEKILKNFNIFNNFLVTLFNKNELNNKNKLYLIIGTYPSVFKGNEWEAGLSYKMIEYSTEYNLIIKEIINEHNNKLIRDKCKNKELNIQTFKYYLDEQLSEKEIELSDRIYYFIDINYDEFYRNILKLYLKTNSSENSYNENNSVYHLPIKFITGDRFMKIEFTRLNIVIYIIEMYIPSEYNFDTRYIKTGYDSDNKDQMSYTKNCALSKEWNIFYYNISNFLENHKKKFYLFNDALIYSGEYFVQNRYFEFFCEFGYILHKLHENKKGDQIYIILPNNKQLIIDHYSKKKE